MDKLKISEILFYHITELHEISADKAKLVLPSEFQTSPFGVMIESLESIINTIADSDKEASDLFKQYYSVCLRGVNPFKDSVLKKAGIDPKTWKRLLKEVCGEF
jgi:hypothetical protein